MRQLATVPVTGEDYVIGGAISPSELSHSCIGAGFAMLEMEVILRTILGHCELSPAREREDTQRRRAVTLLPRHGTRVVMTTLSSVPSSA